MTIADTDKLLVNKDAKSYYVQAQNLDSVDGVSI